MFKTGILILSDKGARGERTDLSGPQIKEMLGHQYAVEYYEIIPDEKEIIVEKLKYACDVLGLQLLLTFRRDRFFSARCNTGCKYGSY